MKSLHPEYIPVNGKTYSLFGKSDSTEGYYRTISFLADNVLVLNPDIGELVEEIRVFSSKKRMLKKSLRIKDTRNRMPAILNLIDSPDRNHKLAGIKLADDDLVTRLLRRQQHEVVVATPA